MSRMSPFGLATLMAGGFLIDWLFSLLWRAISPSLTQLVTLYPTIGELSWQQDLELTLTFVALLSMLTVVALSSLTGKAAGLVMIDRFRNDRRDRR